MRCTECGSEFVPEPDGFEDEVDVCDECQLEEAGLADFAILDDDDPD